MVGFFGLVWVFLLWFYFLVDNGGGGTGGGGTDDFYVRIFFLGKKVETSLAPVRQQLDINDRQNPYFLSPLLLR